MEDSVFLPGKVSPFKDVWTGKKPFCVLGMRFTILSIKVVCFTQIKRNTILAGLIILNKKSFQKAKFYYLFWIYMYNISMY